MTIIDCKNTIIDFVINSSKLDNLLLFSFISGMEAKKNLIDKEAKQPDGYLENR